MGDFVDTADVLHTYLEGVSGITDVVGTNIYGPPGWPHNFSLTQAVAFWEQGGPGHPDLPLRYTTFVFHCVGETQQEAREVFRVVFDALHRMSRTSVTISGDTIVIRTAHLITGPFDSPEPELGWPRCIATFEITMTERKLG